jgi:hypothetical protein
VSYSQPIPETLESADRALRDLGRPAEAIAWELLAGVREDEASMLPIEKLKADSRLQGDAVERLLVFYASRQALQVLPTQPVVESVRARLGQDLNQLHELNTSLEVGSYPFNRAAKVATLRRFPAGPMEWEISGIPRSYFLQAKFPANLRFLAFAMFRLRGLAPCFFMHVAPTPRNRALSIPKEVLRAYYRMARSMEMQPQILGLLAHAWFHDPAVIRDNPHLEVLSQPYLRHGGLITVLAPAPATSGVLIGDAQRRADYVEGKIQYRYGFAIWPRAAAIEWADAHPEFAD